VNNVPQSNNVPEPNNVPESAAEPAESAPEPIADPGAFMDRLRFGPDVEAPPPPDADHPVMVVRSIRMPLELDSRVKTAATARGLTVSQMLREWAELELAALEQDRPISRADALRALAALRPLSSAAKHVHDDAGAA
jgi:predicted DNA-binding protein